MMLEVKGLTFGYSEVPVLRDVNIKLVKGKVLGIIGPNGSGKSTLLKCINRILRPQSGKILLDGMDLNDMEIQDIAKRIGYVPQGNGRSFPATVFDTILLGRIPHITWRPGKKDMKMVAAVIEMLDMGDIAFREMNELSGGQKQKVTIGRALAQEPNLLLLDEPTANLDLKHQLEVLSIVKDLAKDGISAMIAIHDLTLAARFCDSFVMLKKGKVFALGGPGIFSPDNIQKVYDVKVSVIKSSGRVLVVPEEDQGPEGRVEV